MTNLLAKAQCSFYALLSGDVVDKVTKTDGDGSGTFKNLENLVLNLGNDAYALATTVCIIVALLSFVGALILLAVQKQAGAKAESKSQLITILFVVAGMAMAGTIISVVAGIGASVK